MNNQPFIVLMAEDNKHDVLAAQRAWKINKIRNPLHVVKDGVECLDYLYQRGKYAEPGSAPRPGILLLDIKMPRMDGLTVLEKIREDKDLHRLPVIILTTSREDVDLLKSYDLGVNAFISKPVEFTKFSEAIKRIHLFWEVVELPGKGYEIK